MMAEGCKKEKLWEEWFEYLKALKKDIRELSCSIFRHNPKVFLIRKNRHILNTQGLYFWRYIALEKEDIETISGISLSKEQLQKLFTTDIFGKGFIAPSYKLTDLMQIILLKDYFRPINKSKADSYISTINKLLSDSRFKHYCNEKDAQNLASLIQEDQSNYKTAIKYLEQESLLKGYENGFSIMFPISVGAYYIMSVFLSFQNNFMGVKKSCNFWEAQFDEKYKPFLVELYTYLNQLPMLMLTKLYSLFFTHEPTIEIERLIKRGLSVTLCIPEQSIVKKRKGNNWIKIALPYGFNTRNLLVPYPISFDSKKKYESITIALVNEITAKLSELYQNIISEQRKLRMKDAVVAVMGRNISHNIGSHVLAKVSTLDEDLDSSKAKNLFAFIQQRMDFIAQISTTTPSWTMDINLKEVIDKLIEQKYLRDFIADFRGLDSNTLNIKSNNLEKIKVAIPGGDIGCHALYSLIENIMRNAARHGMKEPKELILSITVEDWNDKYYKMRINDNCENGSVAEKLNGKFEDFIIDRSGQLKSEDWGIKEKKICASYLRLISPEEVDDKYELTKNNDSPNGEPYIIKARSNNGNLEYEFFLLKPKNALIVSMNAKRNDNFKKAGIDFITPEEFKSLDKKTIIHKFLVIDVSDRDWIKQNIIENINKLPPKTCLIGNINGGNLPKNVAQFSLKIEDFKEPENFYKELWRNWVRCIYGNFTLIVVGDFSKDIQTKLENHRIEVIKDRASLSTPPPLNEIILFDHTDVAKADNDNVYNGVKSHFPFTTAGLLWNVIKKIPEEPYIKEELIEMGAIKIAVVDDRVWQAREKQISHSKYKDDSIKKLYRWWEKKGIDICTVGDVTENFEKFVKEFPKDEYHFLIFHQGEIDEIQKKIGKAKFNSLWSNLKAKITLATIIDTGRGIPKQAKKDGLRWMHYSSLQECLIIKANEDLAKKRLVDCLFSLKAEER